MQFKAHHIATFINDALDDVEPQHQYQGSCWNEITKNIEGHSHNEEATVTLIIRNQTFRITVTEEPS